MKIKWIVLFSLYNQTCFSYPTNGHRDTSNDAEPSPKCSKNFASSTWNAENEENFKLEPLPLPVFSSDYMHGQQMPQLEPNVNQLPLNYPNNADQFIWPVYFAQDRPFEIPQPQPRPRPPTSIPDDAEVFQPLVPGNPVSLPSSIPGHPNLPNFGEFWPINDYPMVFPKMNILERDKNVEMLPAVVDRESLTVPEMSENGFSIAPKSIRNERPVMIEQNPTILMREPPQLMRVVVENERARVPSMMMEKISVPVMVENEHPEISASFMENKPIIIRSNVREHRKNLKPTMIDTRYEERNLSEFTPIPQVLPERFKRDYDRVMKDNTLEAPIGSSSISFEGKPFEQHQQQSLIDNEIPAHESAMYNENFAINNNQNNDFFYTFNNESDKIIIKSVPVPGMKILLQDHNTSTSTVDKIFPYQWRWFGAWHATSQIPNNTLNKIAPATLSTLDEKLEDLNSFDNAELGNKPISASWPAVDSSQNKLAVKNESIKILMKILDCLSNELKREINSSMSEKPPVSNATKILTEHSNTNLYDSYKPLLSTDANEKTPIAGTNNATDHWIYTYYSPPNVQYQLGSYQYYNNIKYPIFLQI